MKVLLAVNTLTSVSNQAYASHLNLAYRMGKEEDDFMLFNGYRMAIDTFRNKAADIALGNDMDYLMFLDDDVLVPSYTYSQLLRCDKDVVTPLVYIRGYPFKTMMFKNTIKDGVNILDHYEDWEEKVLPNGMLECSAIGCSCVLIKVSLLKQLKEKLGNLPFFHTGQNYTEDVYFCMKARELLDNDVSIFVDTTIKAGHLLDQEIVAFDTLKPLRQFYEATVPELKERIENAGSINTVEGKSEVSPQVYI